jgi:ABC-type uncharacterized transport system substrate-binding protein
MYFEEHIRFLRFCCSCCALLAACAPFDAIAQKQKPKGPRQAFVNIALIYRSDITDYRDAVAAFKKNVPHKFIDLSADETLDSTKIRRRLQEKSIDLVLAVGGSAGRIVRNPKERNPIPTIAILQPPSPKKTDPPKYYFSLSLSPKPAAVLNALAHIQPELKRIVMVSGRKNTPWMAQVRRLARRKNHKVVTLWAPKEKKLLFRISTFPLHQNDVVVICPQPQLVTSLMLKALVRLQHRFSVPVVSFSRRHAMAGLLLSNQQEPRICGKKGGRWARRIIKVLHLNKKRPQDSRRRARKRIRYSVRTERRLRGAFATPVSGKWWYNPAAASHLGTQAKGLAALRAQPVKQSSRPLTNLARPLDAFKKPTRDNDDAAGDRRRSKQEPR